MKQVKHVHVIIIIFFTVINITCFFTVQVPVLRLHDVCTWFTHYLTSIKCSWITIIVMISAFLQGLQLIFFLEKGVLFRANLVNIPYRFPH